MKFLPALLLMACATTSYALESEEFLKDQCDKGNIVRCAHLGYDYYAASNVSRSYDKAMTYLTKACNKKNGDACFYIGEMYGAGEGVKVNKNTAKKFYDKAYSYNLALCKKNDGYACASIGMFYQYGRKFKKDVKKAAQYYQKACDLNSTVGCSLLYLLSSTNGDFYLKDKKQKDNPNAYYDLVYKACIGIKHNYSENNTFYYDFGKSIGCAMVAGYKKQKGLEAGHKRYLNLACNFGSGYSCYILAQNFINGEYGKKDSTKAFELYGKGCFGGMDGSSCYALAKIYSLGEMGFDKDDESATTLYYRACDFNHGDGCAFLAQNIKNGVGTPKNEKLSKIFYQKACKLNVREVCGN